MHPRDLSLDRVHCNNLIVTLQDVCEMFNYYDVNTVKCHGKILPEVKEKAETVISKMLDCFKVNQMKVNDDKFQYIVFCRNKTFSEAYVQVGNNEIKLSFYVKLHGVYFDQRLFMIIMLVNYVEKRGRSCLYQHA